MTERFTPKKESGLSEVAGVAPEEKGKIFEFFRELVEKNLHHSAEIEHSPDITTLIKETEENLSEFLDRYDIKTFDLPTKNVLILDKTKLSPELQEKLKNFKGKAFILSQRVILLYDKPDQIDKLQFFGVLAHELLHLNSFFSLQKIGSVFHRSFFGVKRFGFAVVVRSAQKYRFNDLNEAVTTELATRFCV